jgi:hypothetical protein
MTTQQRIDIITEELRAIYLTDNDGPRLIAEMVKREFPHPRKILNGNLGAGKKGSGDWGHRATDLVGR